MNTTEVKIIEQLLETIKEKDATIKELKDEVKRLSGNLKIYTGISGFTGIGTGVGYEVTNPKYKIEIK